MSRRRNRFSVLVAASAAAALTLAGCGLESSIEPIDESLRADFSVDPPSPRTGDTITYSGAISSGSIAGYRWDYTGDGDWDTSFRSVDTVSTVYDQAGVYRVTLQVEGENGRRDSETREVAIDP